MKTVLFVTFHFPPSNKVAARRTGGLAKYLPLYGWRVVVLTPRQLTRRPGSFEVLESEYEDKVQDWRRLLHLHSGDSLSRPQTSGRAMSPTLLQRLRAWVVVSVRDVLTYPEPAWGWRRPAVREGKRFLAKEGADVILSSLGPLACHAVASTLARDSRLPWVADYRDPWSANPFMTSHGWVLRAVDRRLEARVTAAASAFVGVSDAIVRDLARHHPDARTFLVPNGYDPDEEAMNSVSLDTAFTIAHFGSLHGMKRDPSILFEAVALLIGQGLMRRSDVRIGFYGPMESNVDTLLRTHGLEGVVVQHGPVSRDEALAAERTAQILLIVLWSSADDTWQIAAKVFEYLAARRPILAVGSRKGELSDLLSTTRTGLQVTTVADAATWVLAAYREYVKNGRVGLTRDETAVEQYSQVQMAKRVAEALDYACGLHAGCDTTWSSQDSTADSMSRSV